MEKARVMKTSHGSLTPKSPTLPDTDRHASVSSHLSIDDPTSHLPVFDAHKCFSQFPNHDTQKLTITRNSRVSPLADIADTNRCSFALSPLAHRYANTRNLLSHPPILVPMTNPSYPTRINKKIRALLSKPVRFFRRKCPCSDKKSVQVKENAVPKSKTQMQLPSPSRLSHNQITRDSVSLRNLETKDKSAMNLETADNKKPQDHDMVPTTNLQSQRVLASVRSISDGFTFPVLTPKSSEGDPPRDSMEALGPTDVEPTSVSRSPKSGIIDDDVASDASSDLFEIESFSVQTTSTNAVIYRRRDSLDEASNNRFLSSTEESIASTVTECYEPSEARVDWSVTVAEGRDRASVGDFSVGASEFCDGGDRPPEKCKRRSLSENGFFSLAFAT